MQCGNFTNITASNLPEICNYRCCGRPDSIADTAIPSRQDSRDSPHITESERWLTQPLGCLAEIYSVSGSVLDFPAAGLAALQHSPLRGGVSTFGRSQHTNKILALKVVVVLDILYIKRQIYKGNTGEWRLDKIKQQLLKLAP